MSKAGYRDMEGKQRKGEELDLERLLPWLREQLPDVQGIPEITQYAGGLPTGPIACNFRSMI